VFWVLQMLNQQEQLPIQYAQLIPLQKLKQLSAQLALQLCFSIQWWCRLRSARFLIAHAMQFVVIDTEYNYQINQLASFLCTQKVSTL
jgi:hypothetical protein